MRRSLIGVSFTCPNCNKPVDPTKPNAMMSAATKQWQRKDCWTPSVKAQPGLRSTSRSV